MKAGTVVLVTAGLDPNAGDVVVAMGMMAELWSGKKFVGAGAPTVTGLSKDKCISR